MKKIDNINARKMDLRRLKDLFSQYKQAQLMFDQFSAFCRGAYGEKVVESILATEEKKSKTRKEGLSANQVITDLITKIEESVFSSQEIINKCNEAGHPYNLGTIYKVLNKLADEQKLRKIPVSRSGKRAVDWEKVQQELPLKETRGMVRMKNSAGVAEIADAED